MSEQLTLVDVEGETKLTPRQQAVLRALRAIAQDDGLETSEAGAICHAMKEGRWAHDAESRCVYCSRDGLQILRRLRDLGYARYRAKLKMWQAVGAEPRPAPEPEPWDGTGAVPYNQFPPGF